jgi:hypothetical protein
LVINVLGLGYFFILNAYEITVEQCKKKGKPSPLPVCNTGKEKVVGDKNLPVRTGIKNANRLNFFW